MGVANSWFRGVLKLIERDRRCEYNKVYIKQFGLERSGTNALKAVLELNFRNVLVLTKSFGGKHFPSDLENMLSYENGDPGEKGSLSDLEFNAARALLAEQKLPVVINIKDPVSWVNSYYKYQRKKALARDPATTFPFSISFADKALRQWERNVSSWLSFHMKYERSLVFLHEEIVAGVDDSLSEIRRTFFLEPTDIYPVGLLHGYARRGTYYQHGEELINEKMSFDRAYHLEGKWKEDMPPDVMEFSQRFSDQYFRDNPDYARFFRY